MGDKQRGRCVKFVCYMVLGCSSIVGKGACVRDCSVISIMGVLCRVGPVD
jgi:hypothetical protein